MALNEPAPSQIEMIKSVLIAVDELEEAYTGGDEEGF